MSDLSTKPYLIRAIFEWCNDAGFTPYLNVRVDQNVKVPVEYVKNGEIVLSVANQATRNLTIGNDHIQFSARFNGMSREISVPVYAVQAIFARENGRGYFFEPDAMPEWDATAKTSHAARPQPTPNLQSVPVAAEMIHASDAPQPATETEATSSAAVDDPTKPKGTPRGNLRVIK